MVSTTSLGEDVARAYFLPIRLYWPQLKRRPFHKMLLLLCADVSCKVLHLRPWLTHGVTLPMAISRSKLLDNALARYYWQLKKNRINRKRASGVRGAALARPWKSSRGLSGGSTKILERQGEGPMCVPWERAISKASLCKQAPRKQAPTRRA